MGNIIGISLLLGIYLFPVIFIAVWYLGGLIRAIAKHPIAPLIASGLVLPHFGSKLLDAIWDSVLAGDYYLALRAALVLAVVIAGLYALATYSAGKTGNKT